MVDVTRVPDNAFGYVPTPALVAPIEFTLRRDDYLRARRPRGGDPQRRRRRSPRAANISTRAQRATIAARQSLAAAGAAAPRRGRCRDDGPQAAWLPDGRRLHLNHGPIDLIVEAFGDGAGGRGRLCARPSARFQTILTELVGELPALRSARRSPAPARFRRRHGAAHGGGGRAACAARLHHADGRRRRLGRRRDAGRADGRAAARPRLCQQWRRHRAHPRAGPVADARRSPAPATALPTASTIRAEDAVRGVATSGWRGRSFSLGIADAVTVLARTAAAADAAATIIANAVDLPGHPAVTRRAGARTGARQRSRRPAGDAGRRAACRRATSPRRSIAALSVAEESAPRRADRRRGALSRPAKAAYADWLRRPLSTICPRQDRRLHGRIPVHA